MVTKYKVASDVVRVALQGVIAQCVPGQDISRACAFGDTIITQRCAAVFKSKNVEKGVAFPTCLSVNNCVCHFSPFPSDSSSLKTGDLVKIDLGCHIDGFIAVVAHTLVVPAENGDIPSLPERVGDVVIAANTAAEAAVKAHCIIFILCLPNSFSRNECLYF